MAIKELIEFPYPGSITIIINEHKIFKTSVEKYLEQLDSMDDDHSGFPVDEMINRDQVILIFYYVNMVGSYKVMHYDMDQAIQMMLEILKEQYTDG
jgi:hypothetical protein